MAEEQQAVAIPRGTVVRATVDGRVRTGLKAERVGVDFVHHYLAPLDRLDPRDDCFLLYVDPEQPMAILGHPGSLDPETLELGAACAGRGHAGDMVRNPRGLWLKLCDHIKDQVSYAFVNVATGDVQRRQERDATAIHDQWQSPDLGCPTWGDRLLPVGGAAP